MKKVAVSKLIKGKRLAYNASQQEKYVAALENLVKRMTEETQRKIIRLFDSSTAEQFYEDNARAAMDDNIASQARILVNELQKKFDRLFGMRSKQLAESMIRGADKTSRTTLRASIASLGTAMSIDVSAITPTLKTILKASIVENVGLIKSISKDYFHRVQGQVMRSIISGNGLQDLIPALNKYKGISKRHAKNMALDQTRKVYNSFNKSRLENSGFEEFEWLHSGGGKEPREDHVEMSGNIYRFDDLPVIDRRTGETGIPGQAINCRCTMKPVYKFN